MSADTSAMQAEATGGASVVYSTIRSRTDPAIRRREPLVWGFGRGEGQRIRKAISALEGAGFADAVYECRFYNSPFPGSPRN